MTYEELRTIASSMGYRLMKDKRKERFLPCTCGCNLRTHYGGWRDAGPFVRLECKSCGKTVTGMTEEEAKQKWNELIRSERGIDEQGKNMEQA